MSEHVHMPDLLKYAVIERERRFLVATIPEGVTRTLWIDDHYLQGTRLRLREITAADGSVERKLGHKVRLGEDASEIACTSVYLDEDEWELLRRLPTRQLRKTRHIVDRDGVVVAIDELDDGTFLAEIDDGDSAPVPVPDWLKVIREVTHDEAWTGSALAH
jgi:CYTH domain-containing protein